MHPAPITMRVTFEQRGKRLHVFEKRLDTPEDYSDGILEAHKTFYKAYPDISLFDGVIVIYSKAD